MLGIGDISMNKTILFSKEFTIVLIGNTNILKAVSPHGMSKARQS